MAFCKKSLEELSSPFSTSILNMDDSNLISGLSSPLVDSSRIVTHAQYEELKSQFDILFEDRERLKFENLELKKSYEYRAYREKMKRLHLELLKKVIEKEQEKNEVLTKQLEETIQTNNANEDILESMRKILGPSKTNQKEVPVFDFEPKPRLPRKTLNPTNTTKENKKNIAFYTPKKPPVRPKSRIQNPSPVKRSKTPLFI